MAFLLAAGSFSALSPAQAQEKTYPIASTYDASATAQNSATNKLLVYSYDGDSNQVPVKTLKITNFQKTTVYPILRDGNEAALSSNPNVGLYDPYDTVRHEYRGYIGYKGAGNKYYFGLQPGQSILIRVPLVFWNGSRMGIVTDGQYLTPAAGTPNPLSYNPNAQTIIASAETDPKDLTLIKNGVVMWYSAAPNEAPTSDAPDQLAEWTIRDQAYLSNPKITARTNNEIPTSEKVTLLNYDVSYVDSMFLPVAMEALDVPIPRPPYPPGRKPQPYGWIGAINTSAELQADIKEFTDSKNQLLGAYFNGKGWPIYNIPVDDLKIPSGQSVLADSPLSSVRSKYNNDTYALSSGGNANQPIVVTIGGEGTASTGKILTLSPNEDISKVKFIRKGYAVVGNPPAGKDNPIQPGTTVVSVKVSTEPGVYSTVTLSKPLVASQEGASFSFSRPVSDYASDALVKLWYSWAAYYLDLTKDTPAQTLPGAVAVNSMTLSFSAPQKGLIEGMQVTGPGLPKPDPSKLQGGVVILAIADDKKSVMLSQVASENHPLSEGQNYTFLEPQPLPSTPASLFKLTFADDTLGPERNPAEFAKKVYLIMASMAQIPKNPDPKAKAPHVIQLMKNVIGGNMGFIFVTEQQRFSDDGLTITAFIRDMIKSVLRGVTDFVEYTEYNDKNERVWYPDPIEPQGGLQFNAFNLDPFVWFVHVKLGFSGYGFSLDDDTADVGAGQATRMLLTIAGPPPGTPAPSPGTITTPENPNEWTIQTPYGPVVGTGQWDPTKTFSAYLGITNATNTSPIVITSEKHGLVNGDTVYIDQVQGNTAANSPPGKPFTVANVTRNTFQLLGTTGNGKYVANTGRWTRGPLPYIAFGGAGIDDIYWRIKGDDQTAGFLGALVSGPGVLEDGSIRVMQLGTDTLGIVALNAPLTNANGTPLKAGSYQWILSGTTGN